MELKLNLALFVRCSDISYQDDDQYMNRHYAAKFLWISINVRVSSIPRHCSKLLARWCPSHIIQRLLILRITYLHQCLHNITDETTRCTLYSALIHNFWTNNAMLTLNVSIKEFCVDKGFRCWKSVTQNFVNLPQVFKVCIQDSLPWNVPPPPPPPPHTHKTIKFNTSPPGQNDRHFADVIFRRIFGNENSYILIKVPLKFVPNGPIDNTPPLV